MIPTPRPEPYGEVTLTFLRSGPRAVTSAEDTAVIKNDRTAHPTPPRDPMTRVRLPLFLVAQTQESER